MYRDWTFVDDVVSGIVAAVDKRLGYEIINIGRGEPVLVADFVKAFEKLTDKRAPVISEPMMKADVAYTFANVDKARALLGYDPKVSVQEGVQRFYAWYRNAVGEPAA
jgi:UDP-glucuronate 4-epimerase